MTTRRELLIALGGLATLPAYSQQPGKVWRIGFLAQSSRPDPLDSHPYGAFPRAMRTLGYVEGRNLAIEWRFADDKPERLRGLAAELVQMNVAVIVTAGIPATRSAQQATTAIPIVMGSSADPVAAGLIKGLAHPGGNITGLTNLNGDAVAKQLEMLLRMQPRLSRVGVLVNPANPANQITLSNARSSVKGTKVKILSVEAGSVIEIDNAFSRLAKENTEALIVAPDPTFIQHWQQIAGLATKNRLSSVSAFREYTEAGGLMSYGADLSANFGRAAVFVDKIFKGARPADLPVEQPMKLELFINRKTAKALGLSIPQSLLISADKVIE